MRRRPTLLLTCGAVATSLVLAACGGDSGSAASASAAPADTVAIKHVEGLGEVLVDARGKALYTPDQDTAKRIRCTGECTSFWQPLDPGAAEPTAPEGVGTLAVIRRPDGSRQVTADQRPLYTFSEDAPGSITGDGFRDEFGGRTFVWHLVLAGAGPSPSGAHGGGYGY